MPDGGVKSEAVIDPDYFDGRRSWADRLSALLERAPFRNPFKAANAEVVPRILAADQPGLRAVINIGAASLCAVLEEGRYRNAYERPRIEGIEIGPSARRIRVDRLLFGDDAAAYYFAAVSLGGMGCRFYGEFCMVLRPERTRDASVFDRNSYDLLSAPLASADDLEPIVRALRGTWTGDVIPMLTAKVVPELPEENRLTTPGQISDLILRDEDFAEAHVRGRIALDDIEEVRKSPEESAVAADILERYRAGAMPSPAEFVWASWRRRAEDLMRERGTKTRVVATTGRGFRWR